MIHSYHWALKVFVSTVQEVNEENENGNVRQKKTRMIKMVTNMAIIISTVNNNHKTC
jgi:hypothetical protein